MQRDGKWFFKDRYSVEREKPEGPFAQVTGNMFSLRDVLKKKFQNNKHTKNLLTACGVVFPDIEFKSVSQEIISEIVYDNRTEDITGYMNRVFDYWEERQHRQPSRLSPGDIRDIVQFLRGDFVFIPTLSDRLNSVEKRLVRLTSEQAQLMQALSLNKHLLIEGNAGTGKTLLAVDFAKKKAASGKKVLFLTYNKNLANNVIRQVDTIENLKVINIHALFGEYVVVDVKKMQENPNVYFSEILPEIFYEYLSELSDEELEKIKYDLIIMDEGQDILKPLYLYSLDTLLRGGFANGDWAVFYDEKQNIYNPDYNDGMEILRGYNCTEFKLFVNCRNTVQIGTYSSKISGIDLGEFIRENGEEVQNISYEDDDDFKKKITGILKNLRKEKVDIRDIVFLAPKKYKNSKVAQAGIEVNEIGDNFDSSKELPVYATIQGFKGLDSKIVILTDVEYIRKENLSSFLYIAGTRARTLLYIVTPKGFFI